MAKAKKDGKTIGMKLRGLRQMGKNLDPKLPLEVQNNVTLIEYISICLARVGGILVSTLSGLAATFAYEVYYGSIGIGSDRIADISAVQTTITTFLSLGIGLVVAVVAQKWKTRWGRYRQWYLICLVPVFLLTVLNYVVPTGWGETGMITFKYVLAILTTIFTAFNNLGILIPQVISPNFKEKKTVATAWQLFYYLGYGGAYLSTFIFGEFNDNKQQMYFTLAIIAAAITAVGNVMCAFFCRERIELPKKEKVNISGALFKLFKFKNYRAYYYIQWVNNLAMLGKMSTFLAAITVGSSKNLLLTIPSAAGTVVGNVLCAKLSKKHEPTKLLKFCGVYAMVCATLILGVCLLEAKLGLYFFKGWNSVFFYALYFLFGIGIGVQELSTSHFTVEFNDYLEWQTGERLEAIHGVVPGWINSAIGYGKELLIPYMLVWVGYKSSTEGDLVKTMMAEPTYLDTCLWLLAFLVFGYALATFLKAVVLKLMYDVEGDKKQQMYTELEQMRKQRHEENVSETQVEVQV